MGCFQTTSLFLKGFANIVPNVLVTHMTLCFHIYSLWKMSLILSCSLHIHNPLFLFRAANKQTEIGTFFKTPTNVEPQRHICDPHITVHLTISNLLWHISHKAAKPLGRKLLQLCTLMRVSRVV